jgi:competence protein ComEC
MRLRAREIDVDILQVAHHGSMTSSHPDFIAAVSPTWALIGAGPYEYGGHRLPDATVERMVEETVHYARHERKGAPDLGASRRCAGTALRPDRAFQEKKLPAHESMADLYFERRRLAAGPQRR